MNISLSNIGPISKAEFALDKRFYVFVGYNNSGKTYASYILWSLYANTMNRNSHFNSDLSRVPAPETFEARTTIKIPESKILELVNYYNQSFTGELSNLFNTSKESSALKKSKILLKDNFLKAWKIAKYKVCFAEINDKSDYDSEYILEKKSNSADLILYKSDESILKKEINEDLFKKLGLNMITSMLNGFEATVQRLINEIITSCLFKLSHTPFFLPANRIFFPSYFKYIYSTEAKEFQAIRRHIRNNRSLNPSEVSEYPHTEPVNSLIESISNLPKTKSNDYYKELLIELEELISGHITFSQKEGIAPVEFKLKLEQGENIDMYLASSSSNQLSLLYLYLRYWTQKSHNLLIIDEPEENLHPKNQIKLTNILLKFANMDNNKVLITTHSPLVAETINNDMYLSFLKEANPDESFEFLDKDYVTENKLKTNEYGVYFFEKGRAVEYKADNYGVYFEDFIKEETKVRKISDLLRAKITELKMN